MFNAQVLQKKILRKYKLTELRWMPVMVFDECQHQAPKPDIQIKFSGAMWDWHKHTHG